MKTKPPIPDATTTTSEVNGFKRLRSERPPYDFRDDPDWREYGMAGTSLYMAVGNEAGGVSCKLLLEDYPNGMNPLGRTTGIIGWHDLPEGHDRADEEGPCEVLPGGRCVTVVSYLGGDAPAAAYDEGGEDAVWKLLEEEHANTYGDGS